MSDKKVEAPQEANVITIKGKTFDISTEKGRDQLQGYMEATTELASKKANEAHDLKQALEPYRNYQLKDDSLNLDDIRNKAAQLKAEGDVEGATELLTELTIKLGEQQKQARIAKIRSDFVRDYLSTRPDVNLSAEMVETFAFGRYEQEILSAEDKFGFMDRILQPHVSQSASKAKETNEEADGFVQTLGQGSGQAPKAAKADEEPTKDAIDLILGD